MGYDWDDRDLHYEGGVADVVARDARIAVEAGHTQAEKVVCALREGWSVLVVPYPSEGGYLWTVALTGFLFTATSTYKHTPPTESSGKYLAT